MAILRVGVIGVGRMGERHCRVYSTLRNAHLVGVCDASLTLGNRVAQQYEVPYYANVDELLDRVDAVTVNPYLGRDSLEPFVEPSTRAGRRFALLRRYPNYSDSGPSFTTSHPRGKPLPTGCTCGFLLGQRGYHGEKLTSTWPLP